MVAKKVCDHRLSRRLEEIPLGPPGRLGLGDKVKEGHSEGDACGRSHRVGFCWLLLF